MVKFIGESLALAGAGVNGDTHIATAFPRAGVIVTVPGIHATQREAYLEQLERTRRAEGLPAISDAEAERLLEASVDLVVKDGRVLIRPDPSRMDLAFEADALLQEVLSKRLIRFLFVSDQRVRDAIQHRGEAWRIHPLPKSTEEIKQAIAGAKTKVGEQRIYYYSPACGTRMLTCGEFAGLAGLDDETLRRQLLEIADLCRRRNARGFPEVELFMAGTRFGAVDVARVDWARAPAAEMRAKYVEVGGAFTAAVTPECRHDDLEDANWRNRMYAALLGQRDDELSESDLLGLGAEFFMQVEWQPGARIDGGELIFDSVSDEPGKGGEAGSCDVVVHGLICNLLQEHNDLQYINIGRVNASLSRRAASTGRREVYVAQFRERAAAHDSLQIIRMQKWGVREHLDEGKDLLRAMVECEEYTDFIMDRRLGCRQIGMNLSPRVWVRKVSERYNGVQSALAGRTIWSPYFQRDYMAGLASDKIPPSRLRDGHYALALARLLGEAAAPNIIVGRCDNKGRVIFDDGDEVVLEDAEGVPIEIVVADHTGTFGDYRGDLLQGTGTYADVVNRRAELVPDAREFARRYLDGFLDRFRQIQSEYRSRRRAFDALFRHRRCDPAGNLAYRWVLVLSRLDQARPEELADAIRRGIKVC